MQLTVMTYNIAGCRDLRFYPQKKLPVDPTGVGEVIKQYQPDICGLNEVDFGLPRSNRIYMAGELARLAGPYQSFFARAVTWEPGQYGNAMITKHLLRSAESIEIPDPEDKSEPTYYETRCVLKATVEVEGTPIRVLVTHFGLAKTEQASAVATLLPLIDEWDGPLLLMGDFNVIPTNPILDPIRQRLQDAFDVHPDQNAHTFPSRPAIPCDTDPNGCKIDYVFASKHFKVDSFDIPQVTPSDHLPCLVGLTLGE